MELLVIKSNEGYLRFREEGFEFTGMSKASVYPMSSNKQVIKKYNALKGKLNGLIIKKLIITEENYDYEDTINRITSTKD